jgi:hypothetical protein
MKLVTAPIGRSGFVKLFLEENGKLNLLFNVTERSEALYLITDIVYS